jgi:hypothetical protein
MHHVHDGESLCGKTRGFGAQAKGNLCPQSTHQSHNPLHPQKN